MISCLFNPAGCLSDGVQSLLSLVPFGAYGAVAIAGLIIGAAIGKWGVGALIAAIIAVKVGSIRRNDDFRGEVKGEDALRTSDYIVRRPRPKKGKKYLFDRISDLFGKR